MFVRKFAVLALVGATSVASAGVMDARSMGRAGTGMLMADYYGVANNPALLNQFEKNEQFGMGLNVGVLAADKDGAYENVEEIDDLVGDLDDGYNVDEDASDLDDEFRDLSGKTLNVQAGAAVVVAVPNKWTPMALVVTNDTRLAAGIDYAASDSAYLSGLNDGDTFDETSINSEIATNAVSVTDYGLAFGRVIDGELFGLAGSYDFGATVKAQKIMLSEYSVNATDFDAADFSEDENIKEHSGFNVDLGVNTQLTDRYAAGVRITNLVPQSYKGKSGETYKMSPVMTVGGLYDRGWLKAEANLDLTKSNGFGMVEDSQYMSVGTEMGGKHAQFRLGYRHDMKGEGSVASVGFGLSPFDVVNLDLALLKGSGDAYGVALQLGTKF